MRKVIDCRLMPSESGCTLTISGEPDEVVRAAAEHAVSVHGHTDSTELREQIRGVLRDESAVFIQMIEYETDRVDRLDAVLDEWIAASEGRRTASREVHAQDHDNPAHFIDVVTFPSYERAMENSELPETRRLAEEIHEMCSVGPRFVNLEVRRDDPL
jgi:predicted small metal-binding protein